MYQLLSLCSSFSVLLSREVCNREETQVIQTLHRRPPIKKQNKTKAQLTPTIVGTTGIVGTAGSVAAATAGGEVVAAGDADSALPTNVPENLTQEKKAQFSEAPA